jgi:CelD/BcsL family acetyltransferase involved in cellulose biosynthesis
MIELEDCSATVEAAVAGEWQVRVHRNIHALEETWRQAEVLGYATGFQRFDWLMALVKSMSCSWAGETFAVELLDSVGRSLMFLPLAREHRRGITTLGMIDFGVCDYLAPLILPGVSLPPKSANAFWPVIRAALPKADLMTIPKMPGLIAGRPNPLVELSKVHVMETRRYGLSISPPADDLIKRVTGHSTYRNLGKLRRRLDKRGKVALVVPKTTAQVESLVTVMFTQRRERFRAMGRENLMERPEIAHFYRSAALSGLMGGPAKIFGLSVDGEYIATGYGLLNGTTFALVSQTMADGRWGDFSPGILISAAIMEWAVAVGITYFDLTIGFHSHKIDLGAQEDVLFEFSDAFTFKGALVLAMSRGLGQLRAAARRQIWLYAMLRSARQAWRRACLLNRS